MIKLFMCLFFLTNSLFCEVAFKCKQKKFTFNEKNEIEDLAEIINKLAGLSNINILFPQDEKFSVKKEFWSPKKRFILASKSRAFIPPACVIYFASVESSSAVAADIFLMPSSVVK